MAKSKIFAVAEKLLKSGKVDRAIKEYQKLLSKDPNDVRLKLKIAELYAKKKDIVKAIETYREVADFYGKEKFFLKAIAVLKTILKFNPTLVEVNEKLGDYFAQVGLENDAINQYYIVASFYDNKGMVKEALAIRKKIVEIDPSNVTGRIRLAELMQAEGKPEDSLHEYEKAAEILRKKRDREGLIEVYEKMLYYRPDNIAMLIDLCRIYFEKKDIKRALRRLDSAPADIKKNLEVAEVWCEALLEDHQVDASRRKFKDLYQALAEARDAAGAARVYARVLQEFSDDLDYLKELEEIRKNTGLAMGKVAPKHRQDFEKTEMVDLDEFDKFMKNKQ